MLEKYTLPSGIKSLFRIVRNRRQQQNFIGGTGNMTGQQTQKSFCFQDYDVIGFDLDNTIVRYHLQPLTRLTFESLACFLIEKKSYPKEIGYNYQDCCDFFLKGLLLDKERGNFLKISHDHVILKATHGTKLLSQEDVEHIYGSSRVWTPTLRLPELLCEPDSLKQPFFLFRDNFAIAMPFIVARAIDLADERSKAPWCKPYPDLWKDVLEGVHDMYSRDGYQTDKGAFFPAIKQNPDLYLAKCDEPVLRWLGEIHSHKKTFLLTSSHADYANLLMKYCVGPNWRDFFDLVVTFAKKPGFFRVRRPFLQLNGETETDKVATLSMGGVFSQGNWEELKTFFAKKCGIKSEPRVVYIGDSLVDDVIAPSIFTKSCHAVAIIEEMTAEGMEGYPPDHPAVSELASVFWGSYFACSSYGHETLLGKSTRIHAKIALPSFSTLAQIPLYRKIRSFSENDKFSGYYPAVPLAYRSIS